MSPDHPLDRPVWGALTSRQAHLARGAGRAVRLHPAFGPFAAAADASPESLAALAALVAEDDSVALIEASPVPLPPGLVVERGGALNQMIAAELSLKDPRRAFTALTEDDAAEMFALASLTEPGPFAARTHQLGDFIGVKVDGRLAAMAGERMKPTGFIEVSAVCTHPDFRGRGYAAALTGVVAARILARGETPFLHVYPHNTAAIAVYEALGFCLRREMTLSVLARESDDEPRAKIALCG